MCTAISYLNGDHYFGRNLDLAYHYSEVITVTPRNYPFRFRDGSTIAEHYAMIGMATVADNFPLYYEATNEYGLSMAGLNFPGNAFYHPHDPKKMNIAPFELIPWVLCRCKDTAQAQSLLSSVNIWQEPFSAEYSLTPLHWILCDKRSCLILEPTKSGLQIYQDPVGVLTNSPPFPYHRANLANYLNLSVKTPHNRFSKQLELEPYSLGMGAIGLPGDLSSASRYVRAAFTKLNSCCPKEEYANIVQFFHILGSVYQCRGLNETPDRKYEITVYSSCCNTNQGIYYYTTYGAPEIHGVKLFGEDLSGHKLITHTPVTQGYVHYNN